MARLCLGPGSQPPPSRLTWVAVVALLTLGAAVMGPLQAADELLRNGSLDRDADLDKQPNRWKFAVKQGLPEALYDREAGVDRSAAVGVKSTGPEQVGYWSQVFKTEGWMKRFRLRVAVRTEGQVRGAVSFTAYRASDGKWLAADYALVIAEHQDAWRGDEVEFTAPEGTGSIRIAMWANLNKGGPGTAWFDDLALVCLDPPPVRPEGNLIDNGDFEATGDDTRAAGWQLAVSRGQASLAPGDQDPHSGERCAGLTVEAGGQALLWRWIKLPGPWPLYRISVWMRTDGEVSGSASLSAYDETRQKWLAAGYDLVSSAGATGWQRRVGYYQPPAGVLDLKVALWANYQGEGAGTAWFDEVEVTAVDAIPPTPYVPANPPPALSDEQRSGLVLFHRNYLDLMPPTYVPSREELAAPFEVFACPGEHEPLSIGVYAPEKAAEAKLVVSPLRNAKGDVIEASRARVGVVRYLVKRSHYAMNDRVLVPAYIEAGDTVRCEPGQVRQFWITWQVPDGAAGTYQGTVTVSAAGGEQAVPVSLRVYPFKLAAPEGLSLGMYDGMQRVQPGEDFLAAKYADMRAHGMTTVGFCSNLGAELKRVGDEVQITWDGGSPLEQAVTAYMEAGFPEPLVWLMGGDIGAFAERAGPPESDAYADAYKGVIQGIVRHGREQGWPEIIFQPRDEVFAHESRFARGLRELKLLKEAGVRTEMDGPNVNLERARESYPYTDVLVNAYGPLIYGKRFYERDEWRQMVDQMHRDGKRIWYYNFDTTGYHPETMRFAAGLYLLTSGADGLLSWAYSWGDEEPYDDYSGPRGDTVFVYPWTGERQGGPGLGWEGLREGIDDTRYVLTLRQRIEAALASGDPGQKKRADAAEEVLARWFDRVDLSRLRTNRSMQGDWSERTPDDQGLEGVSGSFRLDVGLTMADYDRFRREVAEQIIALERNRP